MPARGPCSCWTFRTPQLFCPVDKRSTAQFRYFSYVDGVPVYVTNAFRMLSWTGGTTTLVLYMDDVAQANYRHPKNIRNVIYIDGRAGRL